MLSMALAIVALFVVIRRFRNAPRVSTLRSVDADDNEPHSPRSMSLAQGEPSEGTTKKIWYFVGDRAEPQWSMISVTDWGESMGEAVRKARARMTERIIKNYPGADAIANCRIEVTFTIVPPYAQERHPEITAHAVIYGNPFKLASN